MNTSEQTSLLVAMVAGSLFLITQFRKKPLFKSSIIKSKNENRANKIFAGLSIVPVSSFVFS